MTPAFGFSVGDFISGINLIRKITKALKETGGASSEYQAAVVELKGLKHALQHLQALEPTEDNLNHVNAIRGMALACQLPLRDFAIKLDKYESSLGPWADRSCYRGTGRKARWAVGFGAEVEKLRVLVAAKQISINLLLATHTSQTISSINTRTKREHGTLMWKITEQRNALRQVHESVERIENRTEGVESASRATYSKVNETHLSVMSLRTLGEQIMAFIRTFPHDIRDLLQSVVQADWRTYQAVLQIQERLAQSPTSLHDSNIQFTNVLGEYRELPYEYFCQWEPFEGFLRAQFRNKPGEAKVLKDQFYIINAKDQNDVVRKEHWSRSISPGAKLTMSMIMSHLQRKPGSCPRPDCTGMGTVSNHDSSAPTCATCRLNVFFNPQDLDGDFRRVVVSEDSITRQQIEEDLQMYGSRPEPSDTVEVDESNQLANLPPKRSASEFETAVARPAKIRKKGKNQEFNYESLTAMDWNSGASPLDAWLNQSAVPSMTATLNQPQSREPEEDPLAREIEEIKVFRNVHMAAAPNPVCNDPPLKQITGLEFDAQIYYRNILDRYPAIPEFLAHRLAQGNHDRAERLRTMKQKPKESFNNGVSRSHQDELPASDASKRNIHQLSKEQPPIWPSSTLSDHFNPPLVIPHPPYSDFWTGRGGSSNSRPASVHSRSSGMNSSLHGRPAFDPEEQSPTFVDQFSPLKANTQTDSSYLPPPPVDLPIFGAQLSPFKACTELNSSVLPRPVDLGKMMKKFDCDICGQVVQVYRRSQWQRHVLKDLQPYTCIVPACDQASTTYASRFAFKDHERKEHKKIQYRRESCVFCGEALAKFKLRERHPHIARHMEEIAFTVVTKPYEDWDFYSDASSKTSQSTSERQKHGADLQEAQGQFYCHVCIGKRFARKGALIGHMWMQHPDLQG